MILVDTSGLLAALDEDSRRHDAARAALSAELEEAVLSPFILAELDYLLGTRLGARPQLDFLDQVAAGVYELAGFTNDDVLEARRVLDRYHELGIGLADASIVVLAERHGTDRVLTLDERHFRALRTLDGQPFKLLPADA